MSLHETIQKGLLVLAQNPKASVFAEVADSYRKLGEYSQAIDLARNGVAKNPNFFPGKLVLARSLFEYGDLEEAEKILKELFRFSPENVHILRILGQIYFSRGDSDHAKQVLKSLLDLDPSDTVAKEQLAMMDQPISSESIAEPEPQPTIPPATVTLARMYASQGLLSEAKAALFEILSVSPDHPEAKNLLADVEKRMQPNPLTAKLVTQKVALLENLLQRIHARKKAA